MLTNNRSETVAPVKGNDKLRDINLELSKLGSIKEDLKLEISNLEKKAFYYKDIDEKIKESEDVLSELNSEKIDIIKKKDLYNNLLVNIDEIEKNKDILNDEIKEEYDKIKYLSSKINDKQDKLDKINLDIKSIVLSNEEKIEYYKDKINSLNEKLDNLNVQYNNKIEKFNKDSEKLSKLINNLENKLKDLNKNIDEKEKDLSELIKEYKSFVNKIIKIKDEANIYSKRIKKEADQYLEDKKKEVKILLGTLSEKESWLVDKERTLKEMKSELEKFYGKKINNVII